MPSTYPRAETESDLAGILCLPDGDLQALLRDVLARGRSFRFRARGASMQPAVCDGDVLTVAPSCSERLEPGDLVAFSAADTGRLTVHRLIGKKGTFFIFQGDNLGTPDAPVPTDHIFGTVTRIEREGKQVRRGNKVGRRLAALLVEWRVFPRFGWLAQHLPRWLIGGLA